MSRSTSPLEAMRLRSQVRRGALGDPLETARAAEADAFAWVEAASRRVEAAVALPADEDNDGRLELRSATSELDTAHAALDAARASTVRALGIVRDADRALSLEALKLHDPALVKRAAPRVALELLSPATLAAWARGESAHGELAGEVRLWLAGIEGCHAAAAELRAAGGRAPDLHVGIFLLPVLEAFAATGRVAIGSLFVADQLPPLDKPHAFAEWLRERADAKRTDEGRLRNHVARLASVRAAVEAGARTPQDVEAWERGHAVRAVTPPVVQPPTVPNEASGTHRPAEYEPSHPPPSRTPPTGPSVPSFMQGRGLEVERETVRGATLIPIEGTNKPPWGS